MWHLAVSIEVYDCVSCWLLNIIEGSGSLVSNTSKYIGAGSNYVVSIGNLILLHEHIIFVALSLFWLQMKTISEIKALEKKTVTTEDAEFLNGSSKYKCELWLKLIFNFFCLFSLSSRSKRLPYFVIGQKGEISWTSVQSCKAKDLYLQKA